MRRLILPVAVLLALVACAPASAVDRPATPSTFASVVAAAQPGDTILLAAGSYGTWQGTNKQITIKAQSGATVTMGCNFTTGDSGFTLDGLALGSCDLFNGARDITIRNSTVGGGVKFDGLANANVLLDHDTFSTSQDHGVFGAYNSQTHSGVTVRDSLFTGGGLDGVHSGAGLNVIGNEFLDLCSVGANHTDNIQLIDAPGSVVRGNYVHLTRNCETQGIAAYDGLKNAIIEDNVIDIKRAWGIEIYSDVDSVVRHNTVRWYAPGCYGGSACGLIDVNSKMCGSGSGCDAGRGTQVYDNVAIVNVSNATVARSDHNANGAAVSYVGPLSTYSGFHLAPGSTGKLGASDGLDLGARIAGTPDPEPTPTPTPTPTATPTATPEPTPTATPDPEPECAPDCDQTIADLRTESTRLRTELRVAREQIAVLEAQLADVTAERDELAAKITAALAALN